MLIEIYRKEVQEAYEQLLEANDPPEKHELDQCVRGDLDEFYSTYADGDNDDLFDGWWTRAHRDFYNACERLKYAEAREYKRVMAHA